MYVRLSSKINLKFRHHTRNIEKNFLSVMLVSGRQPARMPMLVGLDDQKAPQFLKKLTQRRDCAPSCLSPALLSTAPSTVFPLHRRRTITAAACSPATTQPLSPRRARPHPPDCCCRLNRRHRSPRALHTPYRRGQRSRSPRAAQPPARCHPCSPP